MKNTFNNPPDYYDSPEKVQFKYPCGIYCTAVNYINIRTGMPVTGHGQITSRYPLKKKSDSGEDLYYAAYHVRCGADDLLTNVGENWIQPDEPVKMTSKNSKLVPGIGRIPFPAYRGKDPYIFISYAHADFQQVFAEISRFNNQGYHVWYDEGIAPGNEWEDEIAEHLENCRLFVVFMTMNSFASQNVKDEVYYALDAGKDILVIYLDDVVLTGGLKLRLSSKQAILKHKMSEDEYLYKYTEAFSHYGFAIPVCYKSNETTDYYKPLPMNDDSVTMLAEKIYHGWHLNNKDTQFDTRDYSVQTSFKLDATMAFCISKAADSEIYPANYTMGKRIFFKSSIDFTILENAQKLYIELLTNKGWKNGKYDCENKTTNLTPLGYRSESEEDRMERIVQIIKSSGYDFFISIDKEEKESLFIELQKEISNAASHEQLEKIRKQYNNFPEVEDMVNDAHFS